MNLYEAVELLRVVSAIPVKNSAKHPEMCLFCDHSEGYTLHIKTRLVNAEYRNHLNKIAESFKLRTRESEGTLRIYSQL